MSDGLRTSSQNDKFHSSGKVLVKKTSEVQAAPFIVFTVEYPQTTKSPVYLSKGSLHQVEIEPSRMDPAQYSLLQLSDAILKGDNAYDVQTGGFIELDEGRLSPAGAFAPVIVTRNEERPTGEVDSGSGSSYPPGVGSIPPGVAPSAESPLLDNFLFSPLPKSVVCTVMPPEQGKRRGLAYLQETVNYDIPSTTILETDGHSAGVGGRGVTEEEESVVITDKPVTCRARASLPANYLYFGRSTDHLNYETVYARTAIRERSRFGPLEGVLIQGPVPAHPLLLSIQSTQGGFISLDVSNENTSNWIRYVRAARTSAEQNLVLHQLRDGLYLSSTRSLCPGEELRAWYSQEYAVDRGLPLTPQHSCHSAMWKCSHCHRLFKSATLLNIHVLTHAADNIETNTSNSFLSNVEEDRVRTGERHKEFFCIQCDQSFPSISSMSGHLKTHNDKKALDCPICGKVYLKVSPFRLHIRTHSVSGLFSCPLCSKKFPEYKQIRCHMRRSHTGKNFPCLHCPKVFSSLHKLKIHLLCHSGRKDFHCAGCGKQFSRKDKLCAHMKRRCGVKKKRRTKADSEATKKVDESYLKYSYNCEVCYLGFKRRGMLVNHLASRHPDIPPESVPGLSLPIVKPTKHYACQYCGKVYRSSTKRKVHIVTHHPGEKVPNRQTGSLIMSCDAEPLAEDGTEKESSSYSETVGSVTRPPQSCEWCHRQYASRAKLLQHQRKSHPEELPKALRIPRRGVAGNGRTRGGREAEPEGLVEVVDKVTATDIFLQDPIELAEYELSSLGDGEFIIDANTLKRVIKSDGLVVGGGGSTESNSSELSGELGQLLEGRSESYFKVFQSTSGITLAQPVEVWDPQLCLSLSPPPSQPSASSSN